MKKHTILIITACLFCLAVLPVAGWCDVWGWKKSTSPDDVLDFINSRGAYRQAVTDFEITAGDKGNYTEFIVFYKTAGRLQAEQPAAWGWKKALNLEDAHGFLNGREPYRQKINSAKMAAAHKNTHTEYYIFYRRH